MATVLTKRHYKLPIVKAVALLGYYTAYVGSRLPMFQDTSFRFLRLKQSTQTIVEDRNYHGQGRKFVISVHALGES
jgi:hypothetical protein